MQFFSGKGLILSGAVLLTGSAWANNAESNEATASINNNVYTASGSTDLQTAEMLVNLLRNPHLKVQAQAQIDSGVKNQLPQNANDPVYTAHGKTDRKTAEMLINLLRNPRLKVQAQAQIATKEKNQPPQNVETSVYTVHGKTDKKTAQMLINLFRNPTSRVKAEVHPTAKQDNMRYSISGKTDIESIKKLKSLLKNNKQISITVQANSKTSSPINLTANVSAHRTPHTQQYLYQNYSAIIARGQPFNHSGRPPVFIQGSTLWYPVQVTTQPPSETQVQKVSE